MEPRKNSKTHSPKSGTAKRNSPAKQAGDKKATVSQSEKKDAGAHPFDKFMKKTNPKTAYKNERKQDRLTEEKNKKEFFAQNIFISFISFFTSKISLILLSIKRIFL